MQRLMVVDLEATCWVDNDWKQKEEMETIEIGAVVLDMDSFAIIAEFQSFVKPILNPVLTPFCTELTTIQQADVEHALEFSLAFASFCAFAKQHEVDAWGSWGQYDRKQFTKDCARTGLEMDLPIHLNMKPCFTKARGVGKDVGMKKALHIMGFPLDGAHHRGIDDARNIAKLVPFTAQALHAAFLEAVTISAMIYE